MVTAKHFFFVLTLMPTRCVVNDMPIAKDIAGELLDIDFAVRN